jgi:general secretion pathway protein D
MCTQRAWIPSFMLLAVLIADGVTAAKPSCQEPARPPLSDQEKRKALERMIDKMQEAERAKQAAAAAASAQAPQAGQAATPQAPPPIPSAVQHAPAASGQVQLSYDNADLFDFINQITSALGITPIVIDPEVKGSVTIQSSAPMSKEDVFPLFNLMLKNNNAALIKNGDIYQIVPISSALKKGLDIVEHLPAVPPAKPAEKEPVKKPETMPAAPAKPGTPPPPAPQAAQSGPAQSQPAVQPAPAQAQPAAASAAATPRASETGSSKAPRLATHVIRVEFMPVKDLIEPIKLFMTEGGVIMPYDRLNMLIVTDYSDSVNKILEIIHMFDNNYLNPDFIELIKIKYNAPADVLEDLKKIFGSGSKDSSTGINFVSLDRLSAILVMANSKRAFEEVKRWVKELDATTGRSVQTFIYTVENSTASNIAVILSALYGGEGGTAGGGTAPTTGAFGVGRSQSGTQGGFGGGGTLGSSGLGGTGSTFGGSAGGFQTGAGAFQSGAGSAGGYQGGMAGGGMFAGGQQLGPRLNQQPTISSQVLRGGGFSGLQDNVRIVVDDLNNSLIIQASAADYAYIVETIKKMDVLPRQVIIDARIFEVDLTDAFQFGISANLQAASGQHLTTAQFVNGGALSTNTFAFVGNSREILMALSTLRTKTKVRILEAPSVLALDGATAHIVVGSEYPYPGASYISGVGGTTSSVQYRDTGISLIVMPRISASGHVTLDIAQEVSSPGAAVTVGNGATAQAFNKTSVQTTLSVKDGETVAIAGLIRNSTSVGRSGVPILSDIPLLGSLFGSVNRSANRTELLILITPHVIRTAERLQEMTQELQDSLRNVRKLADNEEGKHKDDMEDAREDRSRKEAKRIKKSEPEQPPKTPPPPQQ